MIFGPVFIGVTFLAFILLLLSPGDPVALNTGELGRVGISDENLMAWRRLRGIEDPIWIQYFRWIKNFIFLDFGTSFVDERPVRAILAEALPQTLLLTGSAFVLTYSIAIPLGVWGAHLKNTKRGAWLDSWLFGIYALPTFWVALMLIILFAGGEYLTLFPLRGLHSAGMESAGFLSQFFDLLWHLVLPVFCLTYPALARTSRFIRNEMLDVLGKDYIRAARAKGLPESVILWRHALRNSLLPLITVAALDLPFLVGGSVIIERIFTIRGMGMLVFEAVLRRDYPVILGATSLVTILTLFAILFADLIYALVDPKIRQGRRI